MYQFIDVFGAILPDSEGEETMKFAGNITDLACVSVSALQFLWRAIVKTLIIINEVVGLQFEPARVPQPRKGAEGRGSSPLCYSPGSCRALIS